MAFQPLTEEQYNNAVNAGFSPERIVAMEKQRKEQNTPPPPNYFQRVGADFAQAGQEIISGIQKGAEQYSQGVQKANTAPNFLEAAKGELSATGGILRSGLRTVGGVASAAFAPVTELPGIKQGIDAVGGLVSKIPGVGALGEAASGLVQKYPEAAKDVKNVVDITTLGVGSGVAKPAIKALSATGKTLEKSGAAAIDANAFKFAQDLVKPVENAEIKLNQVKRTTEAGGLFKQDIVTPTASEIQSAQEVAKIPGISPSNTYQKNFNIIRDYNVKEAQQLENDVKTYDFVIPKKEVISKLNAAAKELQNSPLIVGDAEKMAQKLLNGAKQFVEKNDGKGSGLLQARKDYDQWVLDQKPKAFDAKAENAFTLANRAIRETLNTVLDDNATNLGVKDSLKKQSAIYRAMDNVAEKAAEEANTVFGRSLQRIGQALGTRNKLVQTLAAATGVGVFGAATTFAMPLTLLTGAGFLIYRGGKLVMKPGVRIAIGKLLKESGTLIDATDRAILQHALDTFIEDSPEDTSNMQ